jgi:Ca2+-binding EF-hand superfamily protein
MRWTLPLAALVFAVAAQAGDAPNPPPGRPSVDANQDGIVTREEASTHPRLAAQFDAADTNHDGQLDAAEMNAHREAMRAGMRAKGQERWVAADKDGDGALTREEAQASMPGVAEHFDALDANHDGKVDRAEMHDARMRQHQQHREGGA